MTTYSKYTVAMTFRICFTFGLLTTIYNWYFPTILIVIMAVFNDGAMIALSKVWMCENTCFRIRRFDAKRGGCFCVPQGICTCQNVLTLL